MPPTDSEQHAASLKALAIAHSNLAGYRDLAYKIVIANTTLLVAVCYFAAQQHPSTPRWRCLPAWSWLLAAASLALSFLNAWWLDSVKRNFNEVLELAGEQWKRWGITWPRTGKDRPHSTHEPLVWFAIASGIAAGLWVVVTGFYDP